MEKNVNYNNEEVSAEFKVPKKYGWIAFANNASGITLCVRVEFMAGQPRGEVTFLGAAVKLIPQNEILLWKKQQHLQEHIPANYESYLGPFLFEPYALDLVSRLQDKKYADILEIACGTGRVTAHLAKSVKA